MGFENWDLHISHTYVTHRLSHDLKLQSNSGRLPAIHAFLSPCPPRENGFLWIELGANLENHCHSAVTAKESTPRNSTIRWEVEADDCLPVDCIEPPVRLDYQKDLVVDLTMGQVLRGWRARQMIACLLTGRRNNSSSNEDGTELKLTELRYLRQV